MNEDEYKYCKDFCPLYEAIEEYNEHHVYHIDCLKGVDCDYMEEVARKNRERVIKKGTSEC